MEDRCIWCKHHAQEVPLRHTCAKGHDIEGMREAGATGFHYAMPCNTAAKEGIAKLACPDRGFPTAEELAEHDAERERELRETARQMDAIAPLVASIKAEREPRQGSRRCPACGENRLSWSMALNGHLRMACVGSDCVRFME